jgi:hypothetical protein
VIAAILSSLGRPLPAAPLPGFRVKSPRNPAARIPRWIIPELFGFSRFHWRTGMAKIAKTADRKKVMDTSKSTDCPKCGKPTRVVKRVKDRERNVPGGVFISCSACDFFEKL